MVTQEPSAGRIETEEQAELYMEFLHLSAKWERETMGYALRSRAAQHPAHQQIIDMGECVIPWMLWDFSDGKGEWFAALRRLTGANPIAEADLGYVARMRVAWLEWGRQAGWID